MFDPLRLSGNGLQDEGTIDVCDALCESKVSKIQELDLSVNDIGPTGAESVAAYVAVNGVLTTVWSPAHEPCPHEPHCSMRFNACIHSQLNLSFKAIGGYYDYSHRKVIYTPEGPKAIADALLVNGSLTSLDVRFNGLGDEGKDVVRKAVEGRESFDLKL